LLSAPARFSNIFLPDPFLYRYAVKSLQPFLLSLQENPFPRNAEKLHGREGVRIGIGDYRVLSIVGERTRR
jgi:hypothetical protein